MLRKLFKRKPRLDAAKPEDRIAALATLAKDEQDAFARLFRHDPESAVRLAALARLTRVETLAEGLADEALAAQAVDRLLALIDDNTPTDIRNHPALLHAALSRADTPEKAIGSAARIADLPARAAALAANPTAQLRLAVVEATWEPAALAEFERSARGSDKSVLRVARDRLALLKQASAERDQQDATTDRLLVAATALGDDDPHYDARRDAIERDWNSNLEAMSATDGHLRKFGVVARDIGAIRQRFPARRQPPKVVEVDTGAAFEPLLNDARALRDAAADAIGADVTEDAVAHLKQAADALAAKWNATADAHRPDEELGSRFHAMMTALAARHALVERTLALTAKANDLLRQAVPDVEADSTKPVYVHRSDIERQQEAVARHIERFNWPEELPEPDALAALKQRGSDLSQAAERCATQVETLAGEVTAALAELRECVDQGAVHEAVEADRLLHDLVKRLPRHDAQQFNAELAEVSNRVRELRAWRAYAETPRREALCKQIADLADAPLEVHEQAEAVKVLRAQWNDLGIGDTRRDRELKNQFDRSAERAFEPCRVHFKEQAARRTFNLDQRRAIVGALDEYVTNNDWSHTDWRGVERVLRQARAEWRHYHPVDRKAARDLSMRFEQLADRLHGLLKEQWDGNIALKKEIVADATQVRTSGGQATAKADAIKTLQRRWSDVGPLPRRADQRLWKLFRTECDAVFEARNEVRDRHSQRQRTVDDALALLNELERRVDIDPALNRTTIADYERRLHELGTLPKDLQGRVDAAVQHADRVAVERQNRANS